MVNRLRALFARFVKVLYERWMHFWFEPADARNLSLCRVFFFGALFLLYLPQDFSLWGDVSDSFWMPLDHSLVLFRSLPVLPSGLLEIFEVCWKASLALSCLGLFTRASTVSSFILGIYMLGLPENFGKLHHFSMIVVLILGIMAVSRCADRFSIDRLIWKARQGNNLSGQRTRMSGEYTWPVRAVWLVLALIFFAAGISKLRHSGLEWIFSVNMATVLLAHSYPTANPDPLVSWGGALTQYSWLPQLLAATTVVLEVGYPLALFSSRARWIIVPGVFFMQVGIRVLMGPTFYTFLISNLFWIPWDRVSSSIHLHLSHKLSLRKYSAPRKRIDPPTMRARTPEMGGRRTLDEEETHP